MARQSPVAAGLDDFCERRFPVRDVHLLGRQERLENHVAIRVEHADAWHIVLCDRLLPARLAQEGVRREHRRRTRVFVLQNGRQRESNT